MNEIRFTRLNRINAVSWSTWYQSPIEPRYNHLLLLWSPFVFMLLSLQYFLGWVCNHSYTLKSWCCKHIISFLIDSKSNNSLTESSPLSKSSVSFCENVLYPTWRLWSAGGWYNNPLSDSSAEVWIFVSVYHGLFTRTSRILLKTDTANWCFLYRFSILLDNESKFYIRERRYKLHLPSTVRGEPTQTRYHAEVFRIARHLG